ncbi:MAG: helix-turn-helix domain-containing protein, partial [Oscillospiraceae bacterium]|nr:helix-turn-helix domain-containing protein [Oscillospiraceae bacterium]
MFSETVRKYRKARGLSQEEFAARLSVVRQTVSKWEKGLSVPDVELLLQIAQVLHVSINDLLSQKNSDKKEPIAMKFDVIIVGAGPGGIFAAYELLQRKPEIKVAIFEAGHTLDKRRCPIDGDKVKSCIGCKSCSIMSGFGGAGAFSDGKYNITNDFGGTLYEYIGKKQALDLLHYVDEINLRFGGQGTKLYSTAGTRFKTLCIQNDLHLLDASVRHLGTDINYIVLENLYAYLREKVQFFFDTPVLSLNVLEQGYEVITKDAVYSSDKCIVSVGRSGSKWMESVCKDLDIETKSNRVDIGVRVELPAAVFAHLTDELYESKIVYRTEKYGDKVRTFCMNPKGAVVNENTNGIITVNGH